jgi:hypothetical protein
MLTGMDQSPAQFRSFAARVSTVLQRPHDGRDFHEIWTGPCDQINGSHVGTFKEMTIGGASESNDCQSERSLDITISVAHSDRIRSRAALASVSWSGRSKTN